MRDHKHEPAEYATLRQMTRRLRQMTDELRLLGPQEVTEERRELIRNARRAQLGRELLIRLKSLDAALVVLCAAFYFLLRYHPEMMRHWSEAVPSWLWTGLRLLVWFLAGPFLFLFFLWHVIRTKDDPRKRRQCLWAAVLWGLLILASFLLPPPHGDIDPFP